MNIIHLQSAHSFREYTFYMLNDAETLADLEETGLKFIPMTDYNALKEEVVIAQGKLEQLKEKIVLREQESIEKKMMLSLLKEQYDQMMAHNNLGLEKWCGTCSWSGRVTCDSRAGYFIDTYGDTEVASKIAIMKERPTCIQNAVE